ncbi:AraC family transcriptional regulator [Paenibacillus nanensis]|uniref:AraC family transcriptional regulator n=1 Tax=Paenibacillus nanensis TaxID=393251 RepID=A0A3A1US22_9BACL|nr:AraC family transcriptional regulator [Paenibacillus nanensis]RIX50606.1 AraC family transcriptional regulator [Paenibacillus nanensis]
MQRPAETYRGDGFFRQNQLLYINRSSESFTVPFHNHDFLEIAFIAEGEGFHYAGDTVLKVRKGDLFYIPIGYSHVFRPASTNGTPLIVHNCVFSPLLLPKLTAFASDGGLIAFLKEMESGLLDFHARQDRNDRFQKLFAQLYENYASPLAAATEYLHGLLLQLLIELYRTGEEAEWGTRPKETIFQDILHYLDHHYGQELSLAKLAQKSGFSERHLQRLFHRHTGQSWNSYLQSLRIQKSRELLAGTPDKISAVAEAVGYKDVQTFNALFKRITGLTPRQYRSMT